MALCYIYIFSKTPHQSLGFLSIDLKTANSKATYSGSKTSSNLITDRHSLHSHTKYRKSPRASGATMPSSSLSRSGSRYGGSLHPSAAAYSSLDYGNMRGNSSHHGSSHAGNYRTEVRSPMYLDHSPSIASSHSRSHQESSHSNVSRRTDRTERSRYPPTSYREPSASQVSGRSRSGSHSGKTVMALPPRSEVSSSTIRPSDSVSNISSRREAPRSHVSRSSSRAPSRAESSSRSRAPSHAPSGTQYDGSTIIMPPRTDLARQGSYKSSQSGVSHRSGNDYGSFDLSCMAATLPSSDSSTFRVRITQERTTVRDTIEFGTGPQRSSSRNHQSVSSSGYPRGRILCDIDADKFSGLFGEFGYESDSSY